MYIYICLRTGEELVDHTFFEMLIPPPKGGLLECGLVCCVLSSRKLVFLGVYLFFQRRVREGVMGDLCLFFFQILSGGGLRSCWKSWKKSDAWEGLTTVVPAEDMSFSDKWTGEDCIPWPFGAHSWFKTWQMTLNRSHLLAIFWWMNAPPEITFLGTLMVDFEVLSLQPKKCWCIQNLTGWKDTSFLWFLFPQLLVDSKVNFRNDFRRKLQKPWDL